MDHEIRKLSNTDHGIYKLFYIHRWGWQVKQPTILRQDNGQYQIQSNLNKDILIKCEICKQKMKFCL